MCHCYYEALPANSPTGRLLTPLEIADAIVTLSEDYDADFHVEGGEIFLRPDLADVFRLVPDPYWRYLTITTNGTLPIVPVLPAEKLRLLGDLRVSVEGHTDELQRVMRGIALAPVLRTCDECVKPTCRSLSG